MSPAFRLLLLLPVLLALGPGRAAAHGPVCGAPAELLESGAALPATWHAIRAKQLRIVAIGSASVFGPGTSGPEAAWPARLEAMLAKAHPGVAVEVRIRGGRGLTVADAVALLAAELAAGPADLVLWQTGTVEAVRGIEVDAVSEALDKVLEGLGAGGTDAVLMDPQFSRFLRANTNIEPYRDAIRLAAAAHGVPLLRRYELMRFWAETDRIDLERAPREMRVVVADRLNQCVAEAMAALIDEGIAEARNRAADGR